MIKHFCDRCGREIPSITLYSIGDEMPETMRLGDYDLCPDCRRDFREWIKNDDRWNPRTEDALRNIDMYIKDLYSKFKELGIDLKEVHQARSRFINMKEKLKECSNKILEEEDD